MASSFLLLHISPSPPSPSPPSSQLRRRHRRTFISEIPPLHQSPPPPPIHSLSRFLSVGFFCFTLASSPSASSASSIPFADLISLRQNFSQSYNLYTLDHETAHHTEAPHNSPSLADLYLTSTVPSTSFQDFARVFSSSKSQGLLNDIQKLETETGWKLRVLTKSGNSPSISGTELRDLWKPDEKTIIVIEDLSSPNILNFNTGIAVSKKLPRQFFVELQSRYGNQFYVGQEGESAALTETVQAIDECLRKAEGCKNVPGLTSDLYNLTLATSIAGGCVFGFAARLPPSGRVQASWQWLIYLSPLWLLLVVCFGILPVISRTSELEPLLKNALGFSVAAAALYLTPIFGPSPINKQ